MGQKIFNIDINGHCVLSEDTKQLSIFAQDCDFGNFSLIFELHALSLGHINFCRWMPVKGSSIVALKYDLDMLNFLDISKNQLLLKESFPLYGKMECN